MIGLKEIDNKKIVGDVLLDFSAAVLLTIKRCWKNVCVMAFQPLPYCGFRAIYLIELRGFLMEASLMSSVVYRRAAL